MGWKRKEILQETELSKFEDDPDSLFFFKARFFWVKYPVLISLALFCGSLLSKDRAITMSAFSIFFLTGILSILVENRTRSPCQKCKRNMQRYRYTNNKKGYSCGTVFICENCNSKFIYVEPYLNRS